MQPRSVIRDTLRVLVLDQDPAFQRRLGQKLQSDGHSIETATQLEEAEASMQAIPVDAMVVSYEAVHGADGLARLHRLAENAPLVVSLSESSVSATVAAMRSGADDVIIRRAAAGRFVSRINALMRSRFNYGTAPLPADASQHNSVTAAMIGTSEQVRLLRGRLERFARSDAPVLIAGDKGTGREFSAQMIHQASNRANEPYGLFDCQKASDSDIAARLLGVAGAKGLAGTAVSDSLGGTLVLKNADHLPNWAQAAIAERLIASTQTGLAVSDSSAPVRFITLVEAAEGASKTDLRPDLLHALAVLTLTMPQLGDRREDILPLARTFLERASAKAGKNLVHFSSAAERLLLTHDWPGNLDELDETVQRAVERSVGTTVDVDAIYLPLLDQQIAGLTALGAAMATGSSDDGVGADIAPFRDQERSIIERALDAFDGNITRAAAALEISPSTIHRKRQSWSDDIAAA